MADMTQRYALGTHATTKNRVRARALAHAYDVQQEAVPTATPTNDDEKAAARKAAARQSFASALLRSSRTEQTDQMAFAIAAKAPDSMVDDCFTGAELTNPENLSDAELDNAIGKAFDALANAAGAQVPPRDQV